jgi:hypothetical protein
MLAIRPAFSKLAASVAVADAGMGTLPEVWRLN